MILDRLRRDTRPEHEAVERALALPDRVPTPDEYRRLLERFRGYYAPVEARLAARPWAELGFDLDARRKTPLLDRDLAALGDTPDAIAALPACPALPPLDSLPHALGCLYVLEGATLGGRVITRHLTAAPGGPLPTAFFASYGSEVGRRWREFGAFLTASATGSDEDAIVTAARATFATLGGWLAAEGRG